MNTDCIHKNDSTQQTDWRQTNRDIAMVATGEVFCESIFMGNEKPPGYEQQP